MLHMALVRTDVSEERCFQLTDSCHPDYGGDIFIRNVSSYKSHTASHPWRRHSPSKRFSSALWSARVCIGTEAAGTRGGERSSVPAFQRSSWKATGDELRAAAGLTERPYCSVYRVSRLWQTGPLRRDMTGYITVQKHLFLKWNTHVSLRLALILRVETYGYELNRTIRIWPNRFCGQVLRVPGYRLRGPGFDYTCYQIVWEVVGLELGPLSSVRIIEDVPQRISSSCSL
jgi:hypothetical protein